MALKVWSSALTESVFFKATSVGANDSVIFAIVVNFFLNFGLNSRGESISLASLSWPNLLYASLLFSEIWESRGATGTKGAISLSALALKASERVNFFFTFSSSFYNLFLISIVSREKETLDLSLFYFLGNIGVGSSNLTS